MHLLDFNGVGLPRVALLAPLHPGEGDGLTEDLVFDLLVPEGGCVVCFFLGVFIEVDYLAHG